MSLTWFFDAMRRNTMADREKIMSSSAAPPLSLFAAGIGAHLFNCCFDA
jgi:hypothetical protein